MRRWAFDFFHVALYFFNVGLKFFSDQTRRLPLKNLSESIKFLSSLSYIFQTNINGETGP
jgi:hypothetical protein